MQGNIQAGAHHIPASIERSPIQRHGQDQAMPSSVIRDHDYDEAAKQMRVTFVSGRVYVYDHVPRIIYNAFCKAPSKGAFFNVAIRGRYHFREVVQERNRSAR